VRVAAQVVVIDILSRDLHIEEIMDQVLPPPYALCTCPSRTPVYAPPPWARVSAPGK
jgi:hypothetical protein